MAGHDIGPIERYPARPELVEARAGDLGRLAGQALAQERVTGRSFAPATAHWEGVGAAELRAAPLPVTRSVRAASEALMWAALALRFWAGRIRDFNQRVADIERRWPPPEQPDAWSWLARRVRRDRLLREWREAHHTLVDQGEDETVSMLREGPTLAHLRRARSAGLVPATGVWGFFAARWDAHVAPELAAELAGRLAAPGYVPTRDEAAQLAELLERHADDPAFASFLGELTPDELYRLLANLAGRSATDPDGGPPGWRPLLATIQQGLGVALATATRPGRHQLSAAWLAGLAAAGRDLVPVTPHVPRGSGPTRTVDVYGYQLLGPLLHHGRYGERFLAVVGGDLVDVELAGGGSDVWMAHHPDLWGPHESAGAYRGYGGPISQLRLDWVHGWQPGGPHGFDPMVGLASAMEHHPDGARALLTGATTDQGRLPRLDYLLTDREWPTDLVQVEVALAGFDPPTVETYANPGPESLGRALVGATTEDPDHRSHRIVESIIYEIAHDEQRSGYPNDPTGQGRQLGDQTATFREVDLVPPALRPHLGQIAAAYVDDLHWTVADMQFPRAETPGTQEIRPDAPDVRLFLAELGKDPHARGTIAAAETVYAGLLYDQILDPATADERSGRSDTHDGATVPAASVFGALDVGAASELAHTQTEADQAHNHALRDQYFLAELVTDTVTRGVTAGTNGAAATITEPVNAIVNRALAESLGDRLADHTGVTNQAIGELRELSRVLLQEQLEEAIYRHTPPAELDRVGLLHEDSHPRAGQPIPRSEWSDQHRRAWDTYRIETEPDREYGLVLARAEVGFHYNNSYTSAQEDLESKLR